MAGLPDEITFNDCAAIHGGYTDIAQFLWPVTAEAAFAEELARRSALTGQGTPRRIFAGHCGLPFRREVGETEWINTGSLGLPPNDGRPHTCYAVLDSGQVSLHRLEYNWQGARERMRAVGLTQGYDRCLETGVWPSQDILPKQLRRPVEVR
ncbi:metallophosphoesterase family protein [Sagittula sp. S175]|uniref:metallophosphoesterase family protein n=1 Tax=Sagittula sp. S175 TaxID=3415129 RepID=UPI003C7BEB0E